MSFSSDLKVELSQINNLKNKQEVYAEFLGYLATANMSIKGKNIKFSTRGVECKGCANNCEIVKVYSDEKLIDSWGNRCENGIK